MYILGKAAREFGMRRATGRATLDDMKKPLIETNPYLKDPERRLRMITRCVWQSSVAEGARGLPKPHDCDSSCKPARKASTKKSVNKS